MSAPVLMGRMTEEWIGATPDTPVPRPREAPRLPALRGPLLPQRRQDRRTPALADAHKAKTADDRAIMAKADRIAKKHAGIFPKSKRPLKSRGFAPSRAL